MIARRAETFHKNVDNPVDRLRLLILRAQIEAGLSALPINLAL
jgi:hypothetical protein